MRLIVITPETTVPNEAGIVNELFRNGLQRLHLRKPGGTTDEYRNYLSGIESQYLARVVIHGSFELYAEFGLGGIHLNSAIRSDSTVEVLLKDIPLRDVSTSFHSWQEIEENETKYGYVFISPVFDSISKPGYKATIDLDGADMVRKKFMSQNSYCPAIVGLGGVGAAQIRDLYQHGFDGAAMLGAIWMNDPVAALKEALKVVTAIPR